MNLIKVPQRKIHVQFGRNEVSDFREEDFQRFHYKYAVVGK